MKIKIISNDPKLIGELKNNSMALLLGIYYHL